MKLQLSPTNFRQVSPGRISSLQSVDYRLQQVKNRVNYLRRIGDQENSKISNTSTIIKQLQEKEQDQLNKLKHAILKEFNQQHDYQEKTENAISFRRNSTASRTSRLSILRSNRHETASTIRDSRKQSSLDIEYLNQQTLQAKQLRCLSVKASREMSLTRVRIFQDDRISKVKKNCQEQVKEEVEKYQLREKMYSIMKRMEMRLNESLCIAKDIYNSENTN